MGLIPVANSLTIDIPLEITSISPNTDFNPYGGTQMTIVGNSLPQSVSDGTYLSITFEDGTPCLIETTSTTTITCITEEFASSNPS